MSRTDLPDHLRHGIRCDACWPTSAERALEARRSLATRHRLIDESHYGVSLLACTVCGQRFVSVFTERIDWVNGNDPQEFQLAPISAEEADVLIGAGRTLDAATIEQVASGRWVLSHVFPRAGREETRWVPRLSVGPHD